MALYIFLLSSSDANILGLIQFCISTFNKNPPVFSGRQQPPPVPNPPQMSHQRMYGQTQPHQMPYMPTAGGTQYPPTANTPYPPHPGGGAYLHPYPPNYLHPTHANQSQQNVSNTNTVAQQFLEYLEHLEVYRWYKSTKQICKIYYLDLCQGLIFYVAETQNCRTTRAEEGRRECRV